MSAAATSPAVGSFYLRRRSPTVSMPRFRMAVRSAAVSLTPLLTKLHNDSATPLPLLRHVAESMASDMRTGLAVDGGSDLKMILSYVDSLPSGYFLSSSSTCTSEIKIVAYLPTTLTVYIKFHLSACKKLFRYMCQTVICRRRKAVCCRCPFSGTTSVVLQYIEVLCYFAYVFEGMRRGCFMHWILEGQTSGC